MGAVVVHHFIPGGWIAGADAGVKLFFTLSGFLISGLLVQSRLAVAGGRESFRAAIGRFYTRRFVWFFPLYYAVVGVALVIALPPARQIAGWLLTYTLNIHMARQGWFEQNFAHFWSLAVEEQFYLVWPWIVLAAPNRLLPLSAVAMTLAAPLYRASYVLSGYQNMTGLSSYISTWSCLDALGCGALLAFAQRAIPATVLDRWLYRRVLPIAFAAAIFLKTPLATGAASLIAFPVAQAVVFCAVIRAAAVGLRGPVGAVLDAAPIVYAGRISYGIYVYHPLVMRAADAAAGRWWPSVAHAHAIAAVVATFATLAIAALSWTFFERPLNNLKRFFEDPR